MAVYGIGAMYGGTEDMSEKFLENGVACIGFDPGDAPGLHEQLSKVKAGDVIFIKSYVPTSGLHIKAVGIVIDPDLRKITEALGDTALFASRFRMNAARALLLPRKKPDGRQPRVARRRRARASAPVRNS